MIQKNRLLQILTALVLVCTLTSPCWASEQTHTQIKKLQKRIEKLEQKVKGKGRESPLAQKWMKRLTLSGLLEVEGIYKSDYQDRENSQLELATVELGVDADIHEYVSTHVLFLYEEPTDEDIEVDEAFITLGNPSHFPVYMTAGRQYIPFGFYKTAMISDPMTLQQAETQETVAQVHFEKSGVYGSVYTFNGDVDESGDNHIDNFGANLGYRTELRRDIKADFSLGYLNNIGDTDALGGHLADNSNGTIQDYVPGLAASSSIKFRDFTLIGEYITGLQEFEKEEIEFEGDGARVSAWNAELDYCVDIQGRETTWAVAYQGTAEANSLELPRDRYMASASVVLFDNNVSLSLEYAYDEDYEQSEGGSGEEAHTVTTQVAAGF